MPTQSSACTLASVVSRRFSSLLQVLEKQQASTLGDIEVAKTQALDQVVNEKQRLTDHLKALAQYDHRVQALLGQGDDYIFFQVPEFRAAGRALLPRLARHSLPLSPGVQELQQLPEPAESLGPLTSPQWDEDQQLNSVNQVLSPLCELLLREKSLPKAVAKKDAGSMGNLTSPCPLGPTPPPTTG